MKFWQKTLCATLIVISHACAGQQPLTGLVDDVDRIDFERWKSFNQQKSPTPLHGLSDDTIDINLIIQDPKQIAPNRRIATPKEREALVKIMMRTAIFHQRDEKYLLTRFDFKNYDAAIAANYFIYYEIEDLARDLLDQSTVGFTDINALRGYENLYKYSGTSKETYHQWFQEVVEENRLGLGNRMKGRADQIDLTVQNLRLINNPCALKFGDVKTINRAGFDYSKFVTVSTYHDLHLMGTVIQLPDRDGRERQIVFQNPSFSLDHKKGNDGWSPYTLRAHYAFADNISDYYEWVNARIARGKNRHADRTIHEVTVQPRFDINIHGQAISPNNGHLSGLPECSLDRDEIFSFESKIDGDRGKRIDTFHMLAGHNYTMQFYRLGEKSPIFGDFVGKLIDLQKATKEDFTKLNPHIAKMLAYIEGKQ